MSEQPQVRKNHYLYLDELPSGTWEWRCLCGDVKGSGPTQEACEHSYDRHLLKVAFGRKGRL